jgi:hypothetical protein
MRPTRITGITLFIFISHRAIGKTKAGESAFLVN